MRGSAELWNKIKRVLLPNKIQSEKYLKPGDHIYTWRQANTKHHGIYVGGGKVIHLTRAADSNRSRCPTCADDQPRALAFDGVLSTSLEDFLSGGGLFLFEYGVNPALFLAKLWEGTCTLAFTDRDELVQNRASTLLNNGSGSGDYYRYINNSQDFAMYCKTGLLVVDRIDFSRSCQTAFFLAVTVAVYLSLQHLMLANFTGLLGRYLGIYSICRYAPDIGARPNVIKVEVERLPEVDKILASGTGWDSQDKLQSLVDTFVIMLIVAFVLCLMSTMWFESLRVGSEILKVVWILAGIVFFYWTVLQRRLLSNKIQKEQLKPGDHIYTYRRVHTYAHHGIYVGNRKVIHLDRGEEPISSSGGGQPTQNHVDSCCINCFLDGGKLYLYKYGVNSAFFMAKTRGGTCTLASADPTKDVVNRAHFFVKHKEFGAYNLFNNNCEDFAIYCKTGLFSTMSPNHGKNGQIASFIAIFFAFLLLKSFIIRTSNCIDVAATVYFLYSMNRFLFDELESRKYNKVPVQDLAAAYQTRTRGSRIFMILCFCIFGFVESIILILKAVLNRQPSKLL